MKIFAVSPLEVGEIKYGLHKSPFGWCVIGLTNQAICHLSFLSTRNLMRAKQQAQKLYPQARLTYDEPGTRPYVKQIFYPGKTKTKFPVQLLVNGTNFQLKVWQALLNIPLGATLSYKQVAQAAGFPKAVRAVGSACGKNSIAYLIPCHRVLASGGGLGGYRWGAKIKKNILDWELMTGSD